MIENQEKIKGRKSKKGKRAPLGLGRKIILVICMIVFLGSASVLLDYFINGAREQNALEDLAGLKMAGQDMETDKGTVIGQYAELYKTNSDIIGWIKIEDTKIDYPVMQTKNDPEYYLHRSFDGEYTDSGTPFMDAASDIFIPTANFLIYGHHMKNRTMFHDLLKYEDKSFYENHKKFKFDTIYKGGQGTYEIISVAYSQIYAKDSDKFKYYQYADITTETEFNEYVRGVKALSIYDTGVTAEYGDQLVTLSTCAYHTEEGRFFVVAKRVDAKQVKPQ